MDVMMEREMLKLFGRMAEALEGKLEDGVNPSMRDYEARHQMRRRWPGLKSGNVTTEVVARHIAVLGGEPEMAVIKCAFEELEGEKTFTTEDCIAIWECDPAIASAILYFGEAALVITTESRGTYTFLSGMPKRWKL